MSVLFRVELYVKDIEKSLKFYQNIIGLELYGRGKRGARFNLCSTHISQKPDVVGFLQKIFILHRELPFFCASSGIINIYLESLLQRASEGENRGRILSAFMAVNSALIPLGYAIAGMLSEILDPVWLIALLAAPVPFTIWWIRKAITLFERGKTDGDWKVQTGVE